MRINDELQLGKDLLSLAETGPAKASTPAQLVPTEVYSSTARHQAELATIKQQPAVAALVSDVSMPGDFITTDIAGVPIIVARDRDGQIHAMHNACAHRGATVETRESGTARALSCGFHGWSYQLDGKLRAVADAPLFSSQPCTKGLTEVTCEERHGLIWVIADSTADAVTVRDWLGDELDDLLTYLGMSSMVGHKSADLKAQANWKLLTDGFLELYHLKYLHRKTIAPYFPANNSLPLRYGNHLGNAIPKTRLIEKLPAMLADQDAEQRHIVMNGLTMPIVLMPGTVIEWQAGHVEVFSLRPDPVDPSRTVARLWMAVPAERVDETELWDRNWTRVVETVTEEDFDAAEQTQRNIDAGIVSEIQLGANEELVHEHLNAVDRMIAANPARV